MHAHRACRICSLLVIGLAGVPAGALGTPIPAVSADPTDAKEVLGAARKAIADVQAFSYTFESSESGGEAEGAKYTGMACAAKADAGGWKLYTSGQIVGEPSVPFEIAFDGVSARAVKESEKVVVERTLEKIDELAVFFSGQNARHPIAWEMLQDPAFGSAEQAVLEGSEVVDETRCDKVMIPAPAGGDGAMRDVGTRIFISRTDHLPRKIERVRAVKGEKEEKTITRVVMLTELRTDTNALLRPFTINTPDGFRVRADTSSGGSKLARRSGGGGAEGDRAPKPVKDSGLLAVGSQAPDWTLKDGNGADVKLSAMRGSVVVMDFWATWCGPCRAAMPHVQKLHEKFEPKGLKVYGVNAWERGDAAAYMAEKKYTYGLLLKGDKVAEEYRVKGIPTFYVIDKEGKIAFCAVGMPEASRLEKIIEESLAK